MISGNSSTLKHATSAFVTGKAAIASVAARPAIGGAPMRLGVSSRTQSQLLGARIVPFNKGPKRAGACVAMLPSSHGHGSNGGAMSLNSNKAVDYARLVQPQMRANAS